MEKEWLLGWKLAQEEPEESREEEERSKEEKGLTQELLKARTIIISGAISEKLAKVVYAQILTLHYRSREKPITVFINSPGGDADSGFGIYDLLRFVDAPVITITCGLCASAAVIVSLAADKGMNLCLPNARFLLHQPSTGIRGDASDLQITASEINKTRERYNRIVAEATGKEEAQIAKDADRDFWLSAEAALDYGLVSKIIRRSSEIPI